MIALPVMSDGVSVYQEEVLAAAGTDADTDTTNGTDDGTAPEMETTADAVGYRYEGLSDAGTLVSAYTALLTSPDLGFDIVDGALVRADAPDFSVVSGDVNLAHRAAEADKVMLLRLTWAAGSCTVVTDTPEGEITDPPAPEGMTMEEALDYVRGLPPSLLGLEGSSMEDYRIYALDGMALINGIPCIPVSVYRTAEDTDTNVVEGSFFLSSDQSRIYRLDTATGTVEEVVG